MFLHCCLGEGGKLNQTYNTISKVSQLINDLHAQVKPPPFRHSSKLLSNI